ncbi:MAG: hypothetical protein ACOC8P_01610 [Dichotomicrobium sp.]
MHTSDSVSIWAGFPWTLKMPLGHLIDLIPRWKALLVYLGALIAQNRELSLGHAFLEGTAREMVDMRRRAHRARITLARDS